MLRTYVAFQRGIHDSMVQAFPGALAAVAELRARGSRIGVVTSKGRRVARQTMDVCGLTAAVDFMVCGDEVDRGKPDPEPVHRALQALDLDDVPEEVVFVGDSPHDLRAGRAAGTQTAAVAWGPLDHRVLHAETPNFFLKRMEDVLSITPGDGLVSDRSGSAAR